MARWAIAPHRGAERTTRRGYRLINRMIGSLRPQARTEWATLVEGLLATPASIEPKYFYDALGCTLFQAICELPEYYLTRTERAIFAANLDTIAAVVGRGRQFVDLGAGDCAKGEFLLCALQPRRFVAVDIAAPAIEPALARLAAAHPEVEFTGVVTDFSETLDLGQELDGGNTTFFYPGSSIGNFSRGQALSLLTQIRRLCGEPRRAADRRRPAEGARAARRPRTTMRSASPRRSIATCSTTSMRSSAATSTRSHSRMSPSTTRAESRIEMHLEAATRAGRADRGSRAHLRARRAHSHRELVQVRPGRLRGAAQTRRILVDRRRGRTTRATSRSTTPSSCQCVTR